MLERIKAFFADQSNRIKITLPVISGLILLGITAALGWLDAITKFLLDPALSWSIPNGVFLFFLLANLYFVTMKVIDLHPKIRVRKYREDEFDRVIWRWKYKVFSIEPVVICETPFCKECSTQLVPGYDQRSGGQYYKIYSYLKCEKCGQRRLENYRGYPTEMIQKYRHQIQQRVHELLTKVLSEVE